MMHVGYKCFCKAGESPAIVGNLVAVVPETGA
jgi:hypothetical protein